MSDAATIEFSDATKKLGDDIVKLTLKEAKELSDYLKEVHGIEPAAGGAVMVAGPATGGPGAPAAEEKTEFDVVSTLRANGHDVRAIGVQHELKPIRDTIVAVDALRVGDAGERRRGGLERVVGNGEERLVFLEGGDDAAQVEGEAAEEAWMGGEEVFGVARTKTEEEVVALLDRAPGERERG